MVLSISLAFRTSLTPQVAIINIWDALCSSHPALVMRTQFEHSWIFSRTHVRQCSNTLLCRESRHDKWLENAMIIHAVAQKRKISHTTYSGGPQAWKYVFVVALKRENGGSQAWKYSNDKRQHEKCSLQVSNLYWLMKEIPFAFFKGIDKWYWCVE